MVADTLLYHPTISHYLRFVATTLGRDKALRTLQYLARFLSFYLLRKGYSASAIAPFDALKKQFASSRKVMRIGKNVEHLKAAAQALDSKSMDPVSKYLTVGRQLGYAGYLTLDSLSFLDTSGIYKMESGKKIAREAQRLWMMGLFFSFVNGVYSLRRLVDKEKKMEKTEAEGKIEGKAIAKEKSAVKTQLLSDSCDLLIPLSGLGYLQLDDGMVGLAGLVSSIIGLKSAWGKTA